MKLNKPKCLQHGFSFVVMGTLATFFLPSNFQFNLNIILLGVVLVVLTEIFD
jgi:hypothetical protein